MGLLSTHWTLEQSEFLKELVLSGLSYAKSAAQINAKFNTNYSRNSAIGRANRLGLACPVQPKGEPKRRIQRYKPRPKKIDFNRVDAKKFQIDPELFVCQDAADVAPRNLSLLDLEPNDCRYPFGDGPMFFCGHEKTPNSSYCAPHLKLTRGLGTSSERAATKISAKVAA